MFWLGKGLVVDARLGKLQLPPTNDRNARIYFYVMWLPFANNVVLMITSHPNMNPNLFYHWNSGLIDLTGLRITALRRIFRLEPKAHFLAMPPTEVLTFRSVRDLEELTKRGEAPKTSNSTQFWGGH